MTKKFTRFLKFTDEEMPKSLTKNGETPVTLAAEEARACRWLMSHFSPDLSSEITRTFAAANKTTTSKKFSTKEAWICYHIVF